MAVDFNVDGDYYTIASIADISGNYPNVNGSCSFFFVVNTGVSANTACILSTSQANTGIRIDIRYDDLRFTKGGKVNIIFASVINHSTDMLFVVTYDHTNGAYNLYCVNADGTDYTTASGTDTLDVLTGTGSGYIARDSFGEYFQNTIYELAVWKGVVLTAIEAQQLLYAKIKGLPLQIQPSNLIGYWGFDDNPIQTGINGLVLKDLSFSGADGVGVDADGDSAIIPETILSYPQDICYVDAYSVVAGGNIKKICGIPWANVKKVSGIAKANIKKVAGISAQ